MSETQAFFQQQHCLYFTPSWHWSLPVIDFRYGHIFLICLDCMPRICVPVCKMPHTILTLSFEYSNFPKQLQVVNTHLIKKLCSFISSCFSTVLVCLYLWSPFCYDGCPTLDPCDFYFDVTASCYCHGGIVGKSKRLICDLCPSNHPVPVVAISLCFPNSKSMCKEQHLKSRQHSVVVPVAHTVLR